MGNPFQQRIANFSGGLLEDKRLSSPSHFGITKHFDTFTYSTKLVPYYKTIASLGLSGQSVTNLKLKKFLYAASDAAGTIFRLFGLGTAAFGDVYTFVLDTSINTNHWVALANGSSASGATSNDVFFYYKGFLYVLAGGNTLKKVDATGVAVINDDYQTVTYDNTTPWAVQPVLHPSDDIAYFFGSNVVHKLDNTTWTGSVLTLPSSMTVKCAIPFGNYLAIGCTTLGTIDVRSVVFLWDRDSSLTTLTERIDFGEGSLAHLANLNNRLIGVADFYSSNALALQKGKILIKRGNGELSEVLNEITTDATVTSGLLSNNRVVRNNKLYFPMSATLKSDSRLGIWVVDSNGKVALDTIEENATQYDGIFTTGNMWWIAHSGNGSVSHTDLSLGYSSTLASVYESLVLATVHVTNRGVAIQNNSVQKKLVALTVTCDQLPTGGQIVAKYRVDGATSWTTIFTYSTVGGFGHSAVNIESTGGNLPTYNEIEFRFESTGGAAFTGFTYKGETLDTDIYA